MIWLLQLSAPLVGLLITAGTVGLSLCGLLLFRRYISHDELSSGGSGVGNVFSLAGVLYAVLVAFVVVVVWEQFNAGAKAANSEAIAISDLLRDADALPASVRPMVQRSLIDYTKDVIGDEFPRMRHGDAIEQQSPELTHVWETYIQVEPKTHSEVAFYREAISRLDDLGTARKVRISTSQAEIPPELWVLLLGGGVIMLIFTYMFASPNLVIHAFAVGLSAALMGFVLYLVFALEHPYVGTLSVHPSAYQYVLDTWSLPSH